MRDSIRIALVAVMSLMLAACMTTPNIKYDSDPAQNFASYRTFAWASDKPMIEIGDHGVSPLVQKEIADAIRSNLTARGYEYTTNLSSADFAISYTVGARDKVSVTTYPDFFFADRMSWGWGSQYFPTRGMTIPMDRTVVRNYTEGTLSIDIYDVSRKSPVWHAAAEKRLSRKELRGEDTDIQGRCGHYIGRFSALAVIRN